MILALLLCLLAAAEEGRTYHPVEIADIAQGRVRQTHVRVEGFVTYVAKEQDGDLHIRLCDKRDVQGMQRDRCIVVEQIPQLKILAVRPNVGSCIMAFGIARFDKENGHIWSEIHPLERALPCR